jgi:lysophospholipid acyltransferase (LPLAT)-like uncharacterized protein
MLLITHHFAIITVRARTPIMKINHPLLTKSLGLFGATVLGGLTATLDYRIVYDDPLADPIHPRRPRHAIYLLWHEYLIFPLGVRGKGMTVLISQHRDGELLNQIMRHLRFQTVRGSSTRGSVHALRQILKMENRRLRIEDRGSNIGRETRIEDRGSKIEKVAGPFVDPQCSILDPRSSSILDPQCSLILAPDGPRGPRRRLAEGPIFLASRLQMPIVCMGFAFDRPWRQKNWDRFAVPRPFSRARAVISRFVEIPADLDRHRIEDHRFDVEQILNRVTQEAESWAESGRTKPGQMPLLRHQPAPQMLRDAA